MVQNRQRILIFKTLFVLAVCVLTAVILEVTARFIGFGDPIIYYNAAWGGIRPLPGQQVERLKGITVTIDGNGFRTATPKVQGALRILYLGDSVTWGGSSVDDTMLFTEVAADVLRARGLKVYAMNAGVNGSSLMNQADIYLHSQDSVDVLVWLFPWGDVHRAYATAGYLWPPTKKPRFALVEAIDHIIRVYWLTSFRTGGQGAPEEYIHPEVPYGYEEFFDRVLPDRFRRNLDALDEALSKALSKGIPVIVGITPEQTEAHLVPNPTKAIELLRNLEARGVHIMDLHSVIGAAADIESVYIDNIHFNSRGHRLIGEALGKELTAILRGVLETV